MDNCNLRGHHLICLNFFSGKGYDDAFIENLRHIITMTEDKGIEVHNGTDAVCEKCPSRQINRCLHSAQADDEIAVLDSLALRLLNMSQGQHVSWRHIRDLLPSVFHEWYVFACSGCEWKWACEQKAFYLELGNSL